MCWLSGGVIIEQQQISHNTAAYCSNHTCNQDHYTKCCFASITAALVTLETTSTDVALLAHSADCHQMEMRIYTYTAAEGAAHMSKVYRQSLAAQSRSMAWRTCSQKQVLTSAVTQRRACIMSNTRSLVAYSRTDVTYKMLCSRQRSSHQCYQKRARQGKLVHSNTLSLLNAAEIDASSQQAQAVFLV
jgi:hypothetical protein